MILFCLPVFWYEIECLNQIVNLECCHIYDGRCEFTKIVTKWLIDIPQLTSLIASSTDLFKLEQRIRFRSDILRLIDSSDRSLCNLQVHLIGLFASLLMEKIDNNSVKGSSTNVSEIAITFAKSMHLIVDIERRITGNHNRTCVMQRWDGRDNFPLNMDACCMKIAIIERR